MDTKTKDFIEKAKRVHGDKYDYSNSVYVSAHIKVKIGCHRHASWFSQTPGSHLFGCGCPICGRESILAIKKERAKNKFSSCANEIHGWKYDYSKVVYEKAKSHVEIVCPIHGSFFQTPDQHLHGAGCKECGKLKCADSNRSSRDEFIKKATEVHGDRYDYSSVDYVRSVDPVSILCKIHNNVFMQSPNSHLTGRGCPTCASYNRSIAQMDTIQEFIRKATEVHEDKYDYSQVDYVRSTDKIKIRCKIHDYVFEQTPGNHLAGKRCRKCASTMSKAELEVYEFVKSLDPDAVSGDRQLLKPLELDVISHKNKFAIEFNGLYWHSSGSVETDRSFEKKHIEKTDAIEDIGYTVFHVFENEWNEHRPIVESMIRSRMGYSNKIYARKCRIVDVPAPVANVFFENNHLQGSVSGGSVFYGLAYDNELVTVVSFGKSRYTSASWELLRLASKLDTTVVGGASRLMRHFQKYNTGSIVSYANRRWSTGNVYEKLGFEFIHNSKPCYWYVKDGFTFHRSSFMKHKLKDKLEIFDDSLTERVNMYNNNYRRIWDCGNKVYILREQDNDQAIC